jgi:ornithine decarboxylase
MKCNSAPPILDALAALDASFEVASLGELLMLQKVGVDLSEVLYSNTVKPPTHIAEAYRLGLWRFAFDSEGELYKLARHAPGAAVTIRLRVDDSASSFPLSRKFGAEAGAACDLMVLARSLGLRPYGVTFHVGSQCATPLAWRQAVAAAGRLLSELSENGIELEMLNLGGGFPARYVDEVPSLSQIGETTTALDGSSGTGRARRGGTGRYLVAEAASSLPASSAAVRAGENGSTSTWRVQRRSRRNRPSTVGAIRCGAPASTTATAAIPTRSPGPAATARTPCSTAPCCRPPSMWTTASTSRPRAHTH